MEAAIKVKTITESIGVTIGQPNYSSIKIDVGMTAECLAGSEEACRAVLRDTLIEAFTQDTDMLADCGKAVIKACK